MGTFISVYYPMEDSKSKARVGFALLCALAVCCSVMYITADGAEIITEPTVGDGSDTHAPKSVESDDVKKVGVIYTKTPSTLRKGNDGRERLLDFFDHIESSIAKEVESHKSDVANIRAKMAKDQELNAAARSKMKSSLMRKMAANAKIAKDDLAAAMRRTQAEFARTAALENERHKMDIKRFHKTRALMRANKREARADLTAATAAQRRALAALDSATNEKIKRTNSHIAANSAQIDANDKKFRQWASSKVQETTAQVAAQFADVRKKMAADRAHADKALAAESSRFSAALNAQSALEDEHFAKTVSDIAAAKAEADARVKKFTKGFKVSIAHLSAMATE